MKRDYQRIRGHGGDGGTTSSSKSRRGENAANGCMAALYHLFDFHHFYFSSHHQLTIDSPLKSKGLKVVEESLPAKIYEENLTLNLPVRTKSSRLRALSSDTSTTTCSSEICNSPGSKTPNLVARLMGLDLLPEKVDLNHSLPNRHTMAHPRSSRLTSHSKKSTHLGTRSLPVSPRISSARKSDFDIHRLSLQSKQEEFGCSRLIEMKLDQEDNQSPRDYARQIVKQIKERVVTKRVMGVAITNSVKNRETRPSQHTKEQRRDTTTVSCSPRSRFSADKENKPSTIAKTNTLSSVRTEETTRKRKPRPKPETVNLASMSKACGEKQNQKRLKQKELRPINRCNKAEEGETNFSPHPIKQREAKANRLSNPIQKHSSKRLPKSNYLGNISASRDSQKQTNETQRLCASPKVEKSISAEGIRTEFEKHYITRILKIAGETRSGSLALRSNRVDEVLITGSHAKCFHVSELIEERDEIVAEIERDFIDALLQEITSDLE